MRGILCSAALVVALLGSTGGTAWAGTIPGGSTDDDNDHHDREHCKVDSGVSGPAAGAGGLGSLLQLPGAPGPVPALPGAPVVPDRDPFYRAPDGLATCAPGTVLRCRVVSVLGLTSVSASPLADQLLFRSTDARGHAIAAVTTLLKSNVPTAGPRKVVSYQVFEDSFTLACAPSYTLRTSSGFGQPLENPVITALLANGWDVLVPDHEGPLSVVVIGRQGGRITLDSIRAAENFGPAGLSGTKTPVAMMGYSGGSNPTVWANSLAKKYAPELNLVGVVAGGVVADLEGLFRSLPNPPFFGAALGNVISLQRSYPDFRYDPLLTDLGRAETERDARDASGCAGYVYNSPLATVPTYTRFPDMDSFLADPSLSRVLKGQNVAEEPPFSAPTLIVHGQQDELALIAQVDALVAAECRRGATIDYRPVPGEHVSAIPIYAALAIPYLQGRFSGTPAANTCG